MDFVYHATGQKVNEEVHFRSSSPPPQQDAEISVETIEQDKVSRRKFKKLYVLRIYFMPW